MKIIESIQFSIAVDQIVVTYDDGTTATYGPDDAAKYVAENPGREADVAAMNWS